MTMLYTPSLEWVREVKSSLDINSPVGGKHVGSPIEDF
jgi:hypothetical protein